MGHTDILKLWPDGSPAFISLPSVARTDSYRMASLEKDPLADAAQVFASQPGRIRLAAACDAEVLDLPALRRRARMTYANTSSMVATLMGYGVLLNRAQPGEKPRVTLNPAWREALLEAQRKARSARLRDGMRFIIVRPEQVAQAAETLLAVVKGGGPIEWVATVPDNPLVGLVVAFSEDAGETDAWQLHGRLQRGGTRSLMLRTGAVKRSRDDAADLLARLSDQDGEG